MANFDLLQVHSPNDLDLVRRGPLAPAAELVLFAEVGLPFPTSVNTRALLHACAFTRVRDFSGSRSKHNHYLICLIVTGWLYPLLLILGQIIHVCTF